MIEKITIIGRKVRARLTEEKVQNSEDMNQSSGHRIHL
jgi:hypothetical protein